MKKAGIVLAFALATHTLLALGPMEHLHHEETLAKLGLPQAELTQVISGVEAAAYDSPDSWEKELRARNISLGAVPGLVLQGTDLLCGATGNCQIFVFRRVGEKWLALFEGEEAPVVEGFSFGPGLAQGIKDLHVISNSSADKSTQATYRFDGKFYRAVK
ncbi:MAG: hypothetical protein ACM34G_03090 [Acidobacteriota bacterium]